MGESCLSGASIAAPHALDDVSAMSPAKSSSAGPAFVSSALFALRRDELRKSCPTPRIGMLGIVLGTLVTACGGAQRGLSTEEIADRAEAVVRTKLGLSEEAVLFSDIFIPGYEYGKLMACGTVSGARADDNAISPRRFIVRLEPMEWVRFEPGVGSGMDDFERTWTDICRRPDDRSEVPLLPE